ncbi:MAG: hypothetical protein ABIR32_06280 [Ilumatobacteraceae bacterium]
MPAERSCHTGRTGKLHQSITPPVAEWIGRQQMFTVATAPLASNGHVNVSPKGLDTLRILDEMTVAYLDLTCPVAAPSSSSTPIGSVTPVDMPCRCTRSRDNGRG